MQLSTVRRERTTWCDAHQPNAAQPLGAAGGVHHANADGQNTAQRCALTIAPREIQSRQWCYTNNGTCTAQPPHRKEGGLMIRGGQGRPDNPRPLLRNDQHGQRCRSRTTRMRCGACLLSRGAHRSALGPSRGPSTHAAAAAATGSASFKSKDRGDVLTVMV